MARKAGEKANAILGAAGPTRQKVNHVCSHYEMVANDLKHRAVGYGYVEEVRTGDIAAVHLMIHWLDQRLKRIEEQLAQMATGQSNDCAKAPEQAPDAVQ
jgi:hypothetical protein